MYSLVTGCSNPSVLACNACLGKVLKQLSINCLYFVNVVEYVKESQGGIEESFGLLSTGQWLSIPFILVGIYYIFMAEKPIEDDL